MNYRRQILSGIIGLALAILACNLPAQNAADAVATAVAQTAQVQMTLDALVHPSATPTPVTSSPLTPASQPPTISTPTATSTPAGTYFVVDVGTGANCRAGPSQTFDIMATVPSGTYAVLVGRNSDNSWWYVQISSSLDCWISGVTGHTTGNPDGVPIIAPPPTPTSSSAPTITDVNPLESTAYYTIIGPTPTCGSELLDIGARVNDLAGIAVTYIKYRYHGGAVTGVWHIASVHDQAMGGQYGFQINVGEAWSELGGSEGEVQYQVYAKDNAGHETTYPGGSLLTIPIHYCP
jgi:hypothetical protein